MSKDIEKKNNTAETAANEKGEQQYSLNDDRRVKVLSPGAMVAKRFFRNRIAVVGLVILAFMFVFSFIGGVLTPYKEDQQFYRTDIQNKEFAGAVENKDFRFMSAPGSDFNSILQAQLVLATTKNADSFKWLQDTFTVVKEGEDFYRVVKPDGTDLGIAYKDIAKTSVEGAKLSYDFTLEALRAYCNGVSAFTADGKNYTMQDGGVTDEAGTDVAFVSRYVVQPISGDIFLSRQFQEELVEELKAGAEKFSFTDVDGVTSEYIVEYKPNVDQWIIRKGTGTRVYDTYAFPSKEHWLGTDRHGMDMLTRLMYGGRISLVIGIIVEAISTILGMIMGGLAGYFGKWVDQLIMRIVDIFYCIPSTPILIILGAAMDALNVDPKIRMLWLMLILGFLGWPGMARLRFPQDIQAPDTERHSPDHRFRYHGYGRHDNHGGFALLPGPGR